MNHPSLRMRKEKEQEMCKSCIGREVKNILLKCGKVLRIFALEIEFEEKKEEWIKIVTKKKKNSNSRPESFQVWRVAKRKKVQIKVKAPIALSQVQLWEMYFHSWVFLFSRSSFEGSKVKTNGRLFKLAKFFTLSYRVGVLLTVFAALWKRKREERRRGKEKKFRIWSAAVTLAFLFLWVCFHSTFSVSL